MPATWESMGQAALASCRLPPLPPPEVTEDMSSPSSCETPIHRAQDGTYLVCPFHLHVDVLNKAEVIEKKIGWWVGVPAAGAMSGVASQIVTDEAFSAKVAEKLSAQMPIKVKEKAGIDLVVEHIREESRGSRFSVRVHLEGVNLEGLGEKGLKLEAGRGKQFAETFMAIKPALSRMGLFDKIDTVNQSVCAKLRWKLMEKIDEILPAELAKEPTCLKVNLSLPELSQEEPPPSHGPESPRSMGLGEQTPFLLQVHIVDRSAMIAESSVALGKIKKAVSGSVGKKVPMVAFEKAIEHKLVTQIPEMLLQRAGVKCACRRIRRRDERKGAKKDAENKISSGHQDYQAMPTEHILVEVTITGYESWPPGKLLEMAKGAEFAQGFAQLWATLEALDELGVPNMKFKMVEVVERIQGSVRDGIQIKLKQVLADRLHAEVTTWEGDKERGFTVCTPPSDSEPIV